MVRSTEGEGDRVASHSHPSVPPPPGMLPLFLVEPLLASCQHRQKAAKAPVMQPDRVEQRGPELPVAQRQATPEITADRRNGALCLCA